MAFAIYGAALHNTFSLISKEIIPVFMIAIKLATCTGLCATGKSLAVIDQSC